MIATTPHDDDQEYIGIPYIYFKDEVYLITRTEMKKFNLKPGQTIDLNKFIEILTEKPGT